MCSDALKNSRGYTGKARASYPNGDSYEGEFVDGVSLNYLGGYRLTNNCLACSIARAKELTLTLPRALKKSPLLTRANGSKARSQALANRTTSEKVNIMDTGKKENVTEKES